MSTSPSIAPHGDDQDTYLVLEDFGLIGRCWRETDADNAGRETLIRDLAEGIVAFNAAEGWCRDVTKDIADELRRRAPEFQEIPDTVLHFLEAHQR